MVTVERMLVPTELSGVAEVQTRVGATGVQPALLDWTASLLVSKSNVMGVADVGFAPNSARGGVMVVSVPGKIEQMEPVALASTRVSTLAAFVEALTVQPTALLMVTPKLLVTLALNTAEALLVSVIESPAPRAAADVNLMAKVVRVAPWTRELGVAESHDSDPGVAAVV